MDDTSSPDAAVEAPFFIVARGRSGTTLLSRMLGRHPALAVAPEGFFVANLQGRYGRGPWTAKRVQGFCRDLLRERRMAAWGFCAHDIERRLCAQLPALDYRRACLAVYESYGKHTLGKSGLRAIGDKNPHYALLLPRLLRLFPRARFVHVVRDPRDNVLSYQAVPFDVREPHVLAYRWRAYNGAILDAAHAAPARFHRVRYEDLISEPAATLQAVCRFLDLDYVPDMLSFHEGEPDGFYGAKSPWFQSLTQPLDAARADRWRVQMPPQRIAAVEQICAPLMARLGYARSQGTRAAAPLAVGAGLLLGAASVAAERLIFDAVPAGLRMDLINGYRKHTGRL